MGIYVGTPLVVCPDGSFNLVAGGSDVYLEAVHIPMFNTVQKHGVCSVICGTVHYKEPDRLSL